jgi:hypothetical protein
VKGVKDFSDAHPQATEGPRFLAQKLTELAQKHPQIAEDLGDVANILGSMATLEGGIKVAKQVGGPLTTAKNLAKDAAKVVTKPAEGAKELYNAIATNNPKDIDAFITQKFDKGVRPSVSGKGTAAQNDIYQQNAIRGVKKIVENKQNLELVDEFGDLKPGKVPETLHEFSHAIEQTKRQVFQKYSALSKEAGEAGATVDLTSIADELDDVAKNPIVNDLHSEVAKYAETRANIFRTRGAYTPEQAEDAIAHLNKSLEAFYKNPSYETASKASIDAMTVNKMREGLDNVIESTTAPGYQELKRDYGALKSIEKDVVHRAIVDARKNAKGLVDFTDVFSGSDVVSGLLKLDPTSIAAGATKRAIASYIKFRNNPNTAIKQLFQGVEKS